MISGSIDGDLISGRNSICPVLTPEPSAVSKASGETKSPYLSSKRYDIPHHVTDWAGDQIRQVKRTRDEAAIGR